MASLAMEEEEEEEEAEGWQEKEVVVVMTRTYLELIEKSDCVFLTTSHPTSIDDQIGDKSYGGGGSAGEDGELIVDHRSPLSPTSNCHCLIPRKGSSVAAPYPIGKLPGKRRGEGK
ncbi:hypothetical protein OsI_02329 [Oryza sativa Indica Group]|uniref:Uncharacterized protein n=1 Tax=Oryza sativa subsp. indica TaxID=39946 RepID=B8A9Q5_ORYSI|nr:hypothetical protein OsI_02329 [Oryza sativa Indica Group]